MVGMALAVYDETNANIEWFSAKYLWIHVAVLSLATAVIGSLATARTAQPHHSFSALQEACAHAADSRNISPAQRYAAARPFDCG